MASLELYGDVLGDRLAKHLLRRATFSIHKERIAEFSNYTPATAVAKLFQYPSKKYLQPIHYVAGNLTQPAPWINDDLIYGPVNPDNGSGQQKKYNFITAWWLDEAKDDNSIRAKLSYFLFTNFTASAGFLKSYYFYDYLLLLEHFSKGDWRELVYQISKNNLMLRYLDNNDNTKENPNENFARELLELFTIGKGPQTGLGDYTNYTESDVEEAARCLTGWTYSDDNDRNSYKNGIENGDIPCGFANPDKHDFGAKTFSYRFQNFSIPAWDTTGKSTAEKITQMDAELKLMISMILNQEETAKFVCRKLYRYFVSRNISTEIETDIITPLAALFLS